MSRSVCQPPLESFDDPRWSAIWQHHDALLSLARRRVPSLSDAEDVVHEALAIAAADPNVEIDRAGAWLNRVVRNRCADLARERSYADKRVIYEYGRVRVQPLPEELVCDEAEAVFLSRMLHTLPTRQHEALLHASEGLSNAQIAAAMSTTVKAIESLLVKARRTLRTAAAALVVGFAFLFRRSSRPATSSIGLVALTLGLGVYALHPAKPVIAQPQPLGPAVIDAQRVVPKLIKVSRTTAPTARTIASHRKGAVRQPAPVGVKVQRHDPGVDVKVGPSHTKVSVDQHGSLLNPVPDTVACVRHGVVVSPSYVGCRTSPGRN